VLHLRRQLVAPPQAARLARPPRDGAADQGPVARAVPGHKALQRLVLLGAPRALDPVHVLAAAPAAASVHGCFLCGDSGLGVGRVRCGGGRSVGAACSRGMVKGSSEGEAAYITADADGQ
jgi:hypothetical protein